MSFRIVFSEKALKQLKKLDRSTASLITGWLRKNIEGCSNPRQHGKGLTADRSGQWRYRVGSYRIIVDINDEKVLVLVLEIGHRKNIC
ncbi:type II toxin-antitoxin system RelE family toxin [Lachnoanaerobaculum saburreum]|jgi:plasmid stabilization system protein|uniref:Addiction module toxin, RelE/StbE family n=1 Tax=Lachnoanaerobaculum saburreum DSM 3986 TaxID=887325 RepID=E6LKN5_9FIRM|nr:type II toxin-antitoxin system RelE/ParE family toxin [Lachnoanaerobaculum saburreum]EFU77564.1 addiction module toxin, RelE/StbE family [Lachnoanaerobaculum saburreum DSM 3986]RKW36494.1 MAG: type II toxin-antitoxin system RelE/ParE family toxin [Lachnospiraceae bacterium]